MNLDITPAAAPASQFVKGLAEAALERSGIWDNPYFTALRAGRMGLPGFRRSQEEFFHAVAFFARPMAGLVARSPDYASRIDILHNVVEEHGDFRSAHAHAATFRRFLHSIGAAGDEVVRRRPSAAVHAFNSTLYSAAMLEEREVGIACLGVIEFAFARLSAEIGNAVVAAGWVPREQLVHYALHAELDQRHAEEFFSIIEPCAHDAPRREWIQSGLDLGAHAFDRLYRELHAIAQAAS